MDLDGFEVTRRLWINDIRPRYNLVVAWTVSVCWFVLIALPLVG